MEWKKHRLLQTFLHFTGFARINITILKRRLFQILLAVFTGDIKLLHISYKKH